MIGEPYRKSTSALYPSTVLWLPRLPFSIGFMSCQERDKIILAFALAACKGNNASSDLDSATSESERTEALRLIEAARFDCYRLRDKVVVHCLQHGC
jgi:hypothetical protein